jgi:hypothetical protein
MGVVGSTAATLGEYQATTDNVLAMSTPKAYLRLWR